MYTSSGQTLRISLFSLYSVPLMHVFVAIIYLVVLKTPGFEMYLQSHDRKSLLNYRQIGFCAFRNNNNNFYL